jgi:hypothetical protein
VEVSGLTSPGTVTVTLPAGRVFDAAGNLNTASTSNDNAVTYDVIGPTVLVSQAAGQPDPTSSQPINFTVSFSEPLTGFSTSDLVLSGTAGLGAASSTVTGGPLTFNVSVAGVTGPGTVTLTVPAGGAFDFAGNPNSASTAGDATVTLQ